MAGNNQIIFLIGACGVGKTSVAKKVRESAPDDLAVVFFDTIGVPSQEEMVEQYGSPEEWQRAKTIEWVGIFKRDYLPSQNVLFDAQAWPKFIKEACEIHGTAIFS